MANSYDSYTGDGSTKQFNVNFDYLRRSYVKVKVDGTVTSYTWVTSTAVSLGSAPSNGIVVKVYRETPKVLLSDFQGGSMLSPEDLTESITQVMHVLEEYMEA